MYERDTTDSVSADQICQDRVYHGSWQRDIAEVLIYNRALMKGEEAKVGNYLSNKYGLVTSYSSLFPFVSSISVASLMPDSVGISYTTWAARSNQGLIDHVNDAAMDDPDRDGISNLLEFALGGEAMVQSRTILPVLVKEGGRWFLEYSRSDLAMTSTTQTVEYSSDLKNVEVHRCCDRHERRRGDHRG